MNERDRFYAERDRRTREYGVAVDPFETPVAIVVGNDAADSACGQAVVLALVNMMARLHRHIEVVVPPAVLRVQSLVPASRLDEAVRSLAIAIDPFIRIETERSRRPANSLGVGERVPTDLGMYIGCQGSVATLDHSPQAVDAAVGLSLGGGLAACLGAMVLCRRAIGDVVPRARLCAWSGVENPAGPSGPTNLGPLDLGNVLLVGAGGVGLCFAYWARQFSRKGDWVVLDRDAAELHNTNRCMGLLASDAGWPDGAPRNKAEVAAALLGVRHHPVFYDEFDHAGFSPDVVLAMANERAVRYLIGQRGEPVLVHATTSAGWEAQLHRHVPDVDDCIMCRMPTGPTSAQLACSTVPVRANGERSFDAALPFLSGAAGLMLLAGLYRLQHHELDRDPYNHWALCFRDARRYARRSLFKCRDGCGLVLPAPARLGIHRGKRWSRIDRRARAQPTELSQG